MKLVKRGVKGVLARLGYRLVPLNGAPPREAENLRHLAAAYECLLNSDRPSDPLPGNEARLELLGRLLGTPPPEAYAIAQALARTATIPGDVCEFGVAQGETSAFIANEIVGSSRQLHLFDSFQGLPEPSTSDVLQDDIFGLGTIEAYAGMMACPEEMVVDRLAAVGFPVDRYIIHRGFIESVVGTDPGLPRRVSFAYVDFDFYEPIKVALRFLDSVLQTGGTVIVDDYGFFSTGAKAAVDEFVRESNAEDQRYAIEFPDPRLGLFAVLTRVDAESRMR